MNFLLLTVRLFCLLAIGSWSAITVIYYDPWFREHTEQILNQTLENLLGAKVNASLNAWSLLEGTVDLDLIEIKDTNSLWSFRGEKLRISCSKLHLFGRGVIQLRIDVADVFFKAHGMQGVRSFSTFLHELMLKPSVVPLELKSCRVARGIASIELGRKSGYNVTFKSDTVLRDDTINTALVIEDSSLHVNNRLLLTDLQGFIQANVPVYDYAQARTSIHIAGSAPFCPSHKHFTLTGSLKEQLLHMDLIDEHQKTHITGTVDVQGKCVLEYTVPIVLIQQGIDFPQWPLLEGLVEGNLVADFNAQTVLSEGRAVQIKIGSRELPTIEYSLTSLHNSIQGELAIAADGKMYGLGVFTYSFDKNTGMLQVKNVRPCILDGWGESITERTFLSACYTPHEGLKGTYSGSFTGENARQDQYTLEGSFQTFNDSLIFRGTWRDQPHVLTFNKYPWWELKALEIGSSQDPLLTVVPLEQEGNYQAHIAYEAIRPFMRYWFGVDIAGEGVLSCTVTSREDVIEAQLLLQEAAIKIPYTTDIVREIKATARWHKTASTLEFTDLDILLLNGGALSVSRALFRFDAQGGLQFVWLPIIVKEYLAHWQRNFFALMSGYGTFSYKQGSVPEIKGFITLERSHAQIAGLPLPDNKKENANLLDWCLTFNRDISLDIHGVTQAPLQVKNALIEASAHGHFAITGSLCHPEILGSVAILHGSLGFPYQPLYITSGHLTFTSSSLDDPLIELHARNTVKKYAISLSITGSAKQPRLTFQSYPFLEEEQIITLLLGGSEDGSLFLVMPQALVKSIENLLVSSTDTGSRMEKHVKNLLRPLKHIRIASSLSDQEGQGGFRGSLAIEFSDRLRGLVEKRFNANEQARLEVAYDLSDDTTIRGFKDELGEVGGEIETRWKF